MIILSVGTSEVILILIVFLMLFGAKKIPEVARGLGKGIREFQRATEDIKREITTAEGSIDNAPINSIKDEIRKLDDELQAPPSPSTSQNPTTNPNSAETKENQKIME